MQVIPTQVTLEKYEIAYEQTLQKQPFSPQSLCFLKTAKTQYRQNTNNLYETRSLVYKCLYHLGIGLTEEEQSQLNCLRKISHLKLLINNSYTYFPLRAVSQIIHFVFKRALYYYLPGPSLDFLKLAYYSSKNVAELTKSERSAFKNTEGSDSLTADIFVENALHDFLTNEASLLPDEKEKLRRLHTLFAFNTKLDWKVRKQNFFNIVFSQYNRSWAEATRTVSFTSTLNTLKEGEEFVFSASHHEKNSQAGHGVLFSCGRLKDPNTNIFYLRKYNTGEEATISNTNKILTIAKGIWANMTGGDVTTTVENNLRSSVEQAFFTQDQLQSDTFLNIFSHELLRYDDFYAEPGAAQFARYEHFKRNNALEEYTLENPPQAPSGVAPIKQDH